MARYIDANKLRRYWLENGVNENVYNTNNVLDSIDYQPSGDVVEVKHGEWIEDKTHISKRRKKYVCSNCLHYITIKLTTDINSRRYCYECGAEMKRKDD